MPEIKTVDSGKILCLEHTGKFEQLGELFTQITDFVTARKIPLKGDRMAILYESLEELDRDRMHFAAGMELAGEANGDGEVTVIIQPAMLVASEVHRGGYSQLAEVYNRLLQWIQENGYRMNGPVREYYLIGPGPEGPGDAESYVTEIQIPVERVLQGEDRGTAPD